MKAGHTKLIISSRGMQLGTSVKMGDDKLIKEPCNGLATEAAIKLAGSCTGSAVIWSIMSQIEQLVVVVVVGGSA